MYIIIYAELEAAFFCVRISVDAFLRAAYNKKIKILMNGILQEISNDVDISAQLIQSEVLAPMVDALHVNLQNIRTMLGQNIDFTIQRNSLFSLNNITIIYLKRSRNTMICLVFHLKHQSINDRRNEAWFV